MSEYGVQLQPMQPKQPLSLTLAEKVQVREEALMTELEALKEVKRCLNDNPDIQVLLNSLSRLNLGY